MPEKQPEKQPEVLLEIHDATVARGNALALRDLSWTLRRGEHWAVLGANGSGKSTLVQMLQGWLWPRDGGLSVLGRVFGEDDVDEMRRHVAWVGNELEREIHAHQTVGEIALSGALGTLGLQFEHPTPDDRAEAARALRRMGIASLAKRPFDTLSQGQRRRAVIARALAMRPDLLLLDEATNGLDPVTREKFLQSLAKLLKARTARAGGKAASGRHAPALVYITHHAEEILPEFTHVLLLREGRVVAAGPKSEVLTPKLLEATFGAAFSVTRVDGRIWLRVKGRA